MKPASFNPLSPLGRHNSVSPSIYGSDTLLPSHSSQTSIKASNNRPETGEPGLRFSFVSNTSLHDFKDPLSRKYTRTNFKATSEADTLEEESPAVSRRRAYTKTPTLIPSSFKPGPVQKTSSLKASGSLKSNKQNESTEKIPNLVKKKTGASSPENKKDVVENKRDVLNSPIRLERMFAQKVGVAAKRRKSCHCEWCGGISNLEKKLNRNPSMAFMPRKRKVKKEETPRDEELISNANATMSKTSLKSSRVKIKTGPKQKSLFHSKTLGVQKLASMISSSPKPSNSQERALSIDEGQNTGKSRRSVGEDLCSWKDTGKLEDALEDVKLAFSRNASLVMEQEEEEAQNISLDDREGMRPKKKRKTKKSIRTNIKLDLKLKVSDPSSKDATSPMNGRGSVRKSAFFVINSPTTAKKEVKTVRNEKFTKTFDFGEEARHNSKGKALDSPNKFSWDKFTNQASDIMTVYSQKQTLSPPYFVKLVRTTTEPQSQAGKMQYSVLAWDKKKSPLSSKKQGSESSFLIRSNLSKSTLSQWNLERKRESVQSHGIEKDILGKRFSNFTVREGMSSPVSVGVSLKGERKKIGSRQIEKQVYTVRQSKQGK